jgi:ubiquitin-protein ligase
MVGPVSQKAKPPRFATLMTQLMQRVSKELDRYADDENLKFTVEPIEDKITNLRVTFDGPEGTVYEGGTFFCELTIPAGYPASPPDIKFVTKVYHPNVENKNGKICLAPMKEAWKPSNDIRYVVEFVLTLLSAPDWDTPLDSEIAAQYKASPEKFAQTARDWVQKYAQ